MTKKKIPVKAVPDPNAEPVADIMRTVMELYGIKRPAIAEAIGRSPRMVGKVLNGEAPGEMYRNALVQLRDKGTVDEKPKRRRDKDGGIIPVRGKADPEHPPETSEDGETVKAPLVIPEETGGKYVKSPNRYSEKSIYLPDGNRVHQVTMSKTNEESRERGMKTIMQKIASVARSQGHKDKKVTFTAVLDNGRQITIGQKGGQYISHALADIHVQGGMEKWIGHVMKAMYGANGGIGGNKLTSLNMHVTNYQTEDGLAVNSIKKLPKDEE